MGIQEFFASFKPGFDPVPLSEKLRSSVAVTVGILLAGLALHFIPAGQQLTLLASMGASAVLLYATPHSPMAQPWPLVGGHLISALAGWACSQLISDVVVASAVAAGGAVLLMHLLRCLHPSGAATALIIVLNGGAFHQHGWQWAAVVVCANALLALLLALIINNLIHAGRYPIMHHAPHPSLAKSGLTAQNIEWALSQMEGSIDVSEEDLLEIYRLATEHAKGK